MADRSWVESLYGRLSALRGSSAPKRRPVPRRKVQHRIKVIEKPGADYKAPPHTRGDGDCWCMPDTSFDEDEGVLCVHHREFDH